MACLLTAMVGKAQLVVNQWGRVGINNSSPSSNLAIGGSSSNNSNSIVRICPQEGSGLYIETNNASNTFQYGLNIVSYLRNDTTTCGIHINQMNATNNNAFGIRSIGGSSTAYSYGVYGGSNNPSTGKGAGIFGCAGNVFSFLHTGFYAGYFRGDVRVTGTLYGTLLTPSESANSSSSAANVVQTFRMDGENVEDESVSEKLQQVQLLQFYRSPDENKLSETEIEEQRKAIREARLAEKEEQGETMSSTEQGAMVAEDFDEEIMTEIPQTKLATVKYGLAADQLKAVYPELVYEDADGNVSINYIEMIPLLVQAVNEVKTENVALKAEMAELKGDKSTKAKARNATTETTAINTVDEVILSLSQNRPNPFSTSTSIEVSVPESVNTAALFIFDMSGKQIKRIDITERGIFRVSITSEGLTDGMYLYSLIANGRLVGTKKMILTK